MDFFNGSTKEQNPNRIRIMGVYSKWPKRPVNN